MDYTQFTTLYIIDEIEIKYNLIHDPKQHCCILYIYSEIKNDIVTDEMVLNRLRKTYYQWHSQYITFTDIVNVKYLSVHADVDVDFKTIEDLELKKRNCEKLISDDLI